MIVNNIHVQGLLLATPAFAAFLVFIVIFWRTRDRKEFDWKTTLVLFIFLLIFPVSCLGIGYLLEKSITWTVVYACCSVVPMVLIIIYGIFPDFGNKVTGYSMLTSMAICLIFFIVSVPVAIIPAFRTSPAQLDQVQFDPTVLARSAEEIADKFASFEQALLKEQKKMTQSFETLNIEVNKQNAKMEDLQRTKSELEDQVAKYQEILSLSEDQIISVQSLLKKDRHIDYIIGFMLGLMSSGIVALSGFAFRRVKKHET
jgi:hypothetical protein